MRGYWKHLGVAGALIVALMGGQARAQGAIQQYGAVTSFHVPYFLQSLQVGDGGTTSAPYISNLGLFNGAGCPFAVNSSTGPGANLGAYSQFKICQTAARTTFYFSGLNGQANPSVYFNVGGVDYAFPFGGGGGGVLSLNGLSGILNIVAGSNITVTPAGSSITIAATGGGGGSGTVTSVATDASLTGGTITTSGTLGRAALTGDITASAGSNATTLATVNANVGSFGSTTTVPVFTVNAKGLITAASSNGVSAVLDATFGSARGDVLYRNGSVWTVLAPGTSGQFLQTLGAGADPAWATAGGGGSGCTVSGGAQFQILVNDGASGCSSSANGTVTIGALKLGQSGTLGTVELGNATSGTIKLSPVAGALGSAVLTLPAATDTVAAIAATQTLTNKSISGSSNTLSAIPLTALATQAANTVLVNATSGSASPTAQAISSCSGAGNALIWTTNTGFGCATQTGTGAGTLPAIGTLGSPAAGTLRALTSTTPSTQVVLGYTTAGEGGGTFTYNAADTTTLDNSCTIFVDASNHRWYRQYSGPINVQWCGALGDGSTDDVTALRAALAIGPSVFVPPSATCYMTSGSLTISTNQTLTGDQPNTSCIKGSTGNAATPLIVVPSHTPFSSPNNNITVANLTLDRTTAATAGGDGIQFAYYANNTTLSNLVVQNQYNGISVSSADKSTIINVLSTANYNHGVLLTSTSTYPTIQWNMSNVFSTNNNATGFKATATSGATGGGSCATPASTGAGSMGTWTNLATFANVSYGIDIEGLSTSDCLQGFRLVGGFFGQDGNDEIHLNNYNTGGGQNVIEPTYVELAGTAATGRTSATPVSGVGAGIYLSANAGPTVVLCNVCNQNAYDGLTTLSTAFVQVAGGSYTNNGQPVAASSMVNGTSYTIMFAGTTSFTSVGSGSNAVGTVFTKSGSAATGTGLVQTTGRANGIYIAAGASKGVQIGAVTAGNTAGATQQQYGIALYGGGDYVSLTGANLLNNATSWGTGVATTNSIIAGVLPVAANTVGGTGVYLPLAGGTMTGDIAMGTHNISGVGTLGTTGLATLGSLSVTGVMSINSGMTIIGSAGITGTSAGLDMLNIRARTSLGVGVNASNVPGQLDTAAMIASGAVSGTTGTFTGAVSGTTGTFSGQMQSQDAYITRSIGFTTAPDNVTGHLYIAGNSVAVSGSGGAFSFGNTGGVGFNTGAAITMASGVNISASSSTISAQTVNTTNLGATTMTGALAMGSNNITGVAALTASGQVQAQDLYATRAAGVGVAVTATTGRLNIGGLNVNSSGLAYATGDVDVTGTVYGTTGIVSQGAIAWHTCLYADSGTCGGGNGSLYATNAGINVAASGTAGRLDASGILLGVGSGYSTGTMNVLNGIYLNGTAYTNP